MRRPYFRHEFGPLKKRKQKECGPRCSLEVSKVAAAWGMHVALSSVEPLAEAWGHGGALNRAVP